MNKLYTLLHSIVNTLNRVVRDKVDTSQLTTEVNNALNTAKESGQFDGASGKDGVSVTHEWDGTTLKVTSASGTTSADLKGEPGNSGVHFGSDEPKDDSSKVWVDLSGQGDVLDYVPSPSTAAVGQTIVVKSVDENGKPTEWEVADLASGGRCHPFVDDWGDPVAEIVTSEEVQQIRIAFPTDDYRECLVQFIPAVSSTATDRFMSGNAYIGSAFGGGEGTEFNTAHTNSQIFPSLWYAGVSPEGIQLNTARNYVRLTHSLVANQIKTTPFAYHSPYLGDIGFTVPSEHYFGIGTKVTVWGRK